MNRSVSSGQRLGRGVTPGSTVTGPAVVRPRDAGMVTAELAVGLLSVVIVLMMVMVAVGVTLTEVRAHEAARAAARSAARGDEPAQIRRAAQRSAPGARVSIARSDTHVMIDVAVRFSPPIPMLRYSGITVRAHAVADREPP